MRALPIPRTYSNAALYAAHSNAPYVIAILAHALSKLLNCMHAIRAGCLYSYAGHAALSEVRAITRASCASSSRPAGYPAMGGGLPLAAISALTGMHRLSTLARKCASFESGAS